MALNSTDNRMLHEILLDDVNQMLVVYDQAVQQLLEAIRHDGYFDDLDPDALIWPKSQSDSGSIDLDGLVFRARLIDAIYRGLPAIRDARLAEAHEKFAKLMPHYHAGNRIYLQIKRQFVTRGAGDAPDFLKLYQSLYLDALVKGELHAPPAVEAALAQVNIMQVPLSHAQAVAEALSKVEVSDDSRWQETYEYVLEDQSVSGTLHTLLQDVAQRTLDLIAAGGLLAARYNYLTNFGWFGISVWKVIADADVALYRLGKGADQAALNELTNRLYRIKAMLIEFLQAHQESPTQMRPNAYWYGQEYSYLTRDMIDLTRAILKQTNHLLQNQGMSDVLEAPSLLTDTAAGRFLEYPQVGRKGNFSKLQRMVRFARWMAASWTLGRYKQKLLKTEPDDIRRRENGWQGWLNWSQKTLRIFNVQVDIYIDPQFEAVADELRLNVDDNKVIFLPTHQSLFDQPLMYRVLQSPEFLHAMHWKRPEPCVILARTGLARSGIKIGKKQITQFGVSSEDFDHLLEAVDGYVLLEKSNATGHTTQRVAKALSERPGIIYPMATTAAFPIQQFPMQHGVFAQLPQDVVIVPIAFRGIHALWPKCPKGNMDIHPGRVEVWVSPPMLGETTLLPKRRSLRIQAEAAALFLAVHIATLLNPEDSHGR